MTAFIADLRFAWRRLCKGPAYSAAAALILALGIGVSVAMFSVLEGVVLSGLPYPGGDRVVAVSLHNPQLKDSHARLTSAEAERLAADEGVFEAFGFYNWAGMTVLDGGRPREVTFNFVSPGFFAALGVAPLHGRWIEAADMEGGEPVVVLSFVEWQRLAGGDPAVIGRSIDSSSEGRLRVIGVMPASFAYPVTDVGAWRPYPRAQLQPDQPGYRNARFLDAVARLPVNADAAAVRHRAQAVIEAVRQDYGQPDAGWRVTATPLLEEQLGGLRPALWASFAVAMLVLLIACANVAILVDARQIAQRHDQALVQALGASRLRVYRSLLLELGLLGMAGALIGTVLAMFGLDALTALASDVLPRSETITLNARVLAFAVAMALITPLLSLLTGSLRPRGQAMDAMRSAGRGLVAGTRSRARALPVLGVALSTVGLVAAAAMVASLVRIKDVEPGFRTDNVLAVQLFSSDRADTWAAFAQQVRERLAAVPGVQQVAVTTAPPLSNIGNLLIEMRVPGRAEPEPMQASVRRVSAGYLDVLGVPLRAGRDIQDSDRGNGERVAVINQALQRQVFGDRDALGQMISVPLGEGGWTDYRIVGISGDIRNAGLRRDVAPEILLPFEQVPWVGMSFLVRSAGPVEGMPALLRQALWQVAPLQATTREFALSDDLADQLAPARFFAGTVAALALCALLLAALGVYAVAAQYQQGRRPEFGLRLAVGAPPALLARQSLLASLRGALLGIAIGALLGWVLLRVVSGYLFQFGGGYAPWLVMALLAMLAAVVLASLPSAWRAAHTDPATVLRDA